MLRKSNILVGSRTATQRNRKPCRAARTEPHIRSRRDLNGDSEADQHLLTHGWYCGRNLHIYGVSGCASLIKTGDATTFSGSYTVSPKQTITGS